MKISEKELIELTIKYGFDGCELENKYFKEKGHLRKGSDSHNAFIKKLDSMCENFTRLRKSRKEKEVFYEINGLREAIEGYTGGRGNGHSHIDNIIAQVIYNYLVENPNVTSEPKTYRTWAYLFKLPIYETKLKDQGDEEFIVNELSAYFTKNHSMNIINQFRKRLQRRAGDTVKNIFSILKKEKKIEVHTVYCGVDSNNQVVDFNLDGYNKVKEDLNLYLEDFGVTYAKWYFGKKTEEIHEIENKLLNKHNVKSIFKRYKVDIINWNGNPNHSSDSNEFYNIYFERLLELSKQRQKKNDKTKDNNFPFERDHLAVMTIMIGFVFYNMEGMDIPKIYPDIHRRLLQQRQRDIEEYNLKRCEQEQEMFIERLKKGTAFTSNPNLKIYMPEEEQKEDDEHI